MSERPAGPPLKVQHAQLSDLGMRRPNNQDAVTSHITDDRDTWHRRGHLFMVADGMGAHAAGELASKLAVDNVPHAYYKSTDPSPAAALRQAVRAANAVIHNKGNDSIDFQGMGTTCTCLALLPQGALVAHVGDSRAYRLRGDEFEQLSFDHSLIWEAAAAGHVPEENLLSVLPRNVITRSLGPHDTVNVDLEGPFDIQQNDVFLVCSDGLSGQVTDQEIGTILNCLVPDDAVQTLVDIANLRGGPDNISVAVARIADEDHEPRPGDAEPLPRRPAAVRHVPMFVWLAMLASAAVLFGSFLASAPLLGILGAAGLGASLTVAAYHLFGPQGSVRLTSLPGPFGNGPYRKYDCTPDRPVVESLSQLTDELRRLTDQDSWPVDIGWDVFQQHQKQATDAVRSGDFATAVVALCGAIRDTMQQLRDRRATLTTQSGVNLDLGGIFDTDGNRQPEDPLDEEGPADSEGDKPEG